MHRPHSQQRTAGPIFFCGRPCHVRRGFTIVELLVALAVIGVLLALALPALGRARTAAKKAQCLNNIRNLALAMTQLEQAQRKLPASGNYIANGPTSTSHNHSWAVSILPWIDQQNLYNQWKLDRSITDPVNRPLTEALIPVFVCPLDLTRSPSDGAHGDLSYVVNGGVGFTVGPAIGYDDCPFAPWGGPLDLNGNGFSCNRTTQDEEDYACFKRMGLFFLENWKSGVDRHYALADIHDGLTQTFMLTENVRAGYDPEDEEASYANPNPYRCAAYIGCPCLNQSCRPGNVDYSRSNSGRSQINSGLWSAEGASPVPNSFHEGGVHVAYADGHVSLLSEKVDGATYAALASPQGSMLDGTVLKQAIVSTGF
jgi:prepilin-type N-terminal cleavage/methylation domain-containing protein/prepilin-type processing-associated H-X9-DG protein